MFMIMKLGDENMSIYHIVHTNFFQNKTLKE